MADKRMTLDDLVGELRSGMTIGIGGWGSRRKPMAAVRAILRSDLTDLTVVSYGGPDVGPAVRRRQGGQGGVRIRHPRLHPHRPPLQGGPPDRRHRGHGDRRGHVLPGPAGRLPAGALPPHPGRAGLRRAAGSIPSLRTVISPYDDGEELVAMPALRLDAAVVHVNRADASGLRPDPRTRPLLRRAVPRRRRAAVRDHRADRRHRPVRVGGPAPDHVHQPAADRRCGRDPGRRPLHRLRSRLRPGRGVPEGVRGRRRPIPTLWAAFRRRYLDVDEADYQAATGERGRRRGRGQGASRSGA